MKKGRIWRRRVLIGAAVAAGLGLVVILAALWALGRPAVEQRIVGRLSSWTEAQLGFGVEAERFRLRPVSGALEVEDLRLAVRGGLPFARVERLQARWRPLSLLRGRPLVEVLDIERPRLDLAAPLPESREQAVDAEPLEELPLAVERLSVRGGTLAGGPVSEAVSGWVVEDLRIEAGFDGRQVSVRELETSAVVDLTGRGRRSFEIFTRATADLAGTTEIESLRLSGDGLAAEITGRAGAAVDLVDLAFDLALDPGIWLDGGATGPVRSRGEVDLGAWEGTVVVEGGGQPARLLAGFLSPELAAMLELDETALDLAADLELAPERSVAGTVRLDGARPEGRLVGLTLRPRLELGETVRAVVDVEASLLADESGARRMTATLTSPDVPRLESWMIEDGSVAVDHPQVERLARRVAALYPLLLDPASLDALPPLGSLEANGRFAGPVADPDVDVEAELRPHAGARIGLAVAGQPAAGRLTIETEGSGVDLAHFAPEAAGQVEWTGSVDDLLGAARGRLELAARGVGTVDSELVSELGLEVDGSRQEIGWELAARPTGAESLAARGTVRPELPLAAATGEWSVVTGEERLPRVDGSFELAAGALALEVSAVPAGREAATLAARAPLQTLAALPQLEALADLPLAGAGGPLEVEWRAAPGEWRGLLPPALAERVGRLVASTSGRFEIDAACPACSRGELVLGAVELEVDGRSAAAAGDLEVSLADGRLVLAPWSLRGAGLELELEGELELDRDWRAGDDPADLAVTSSARLGGEVDSTWLTSLPLEVVTPGALAIAAEIGGPLGELRGSATVEAPELAVTPKGYPDVVVGGPAARLSLAAGVLSWDGARVTVGEALLASSGRTELADPLGAAAGRLEVDTNLPVLEALDLPFVVEDGRLTIESGALRTAEGPGTLAVGLPLAAGTAGTADLAWDVPVNDWAPLLRRLGGGDDPEVLEFSSRGVLEVPLERPGLAAGRADLGAARIVMRGRESRIEPALAVAAADGMVRIEPFVLRSASETFEFEADAALAPDWAPGAPVADLVTRFEVTGGGTVDAGLLNPFLAGGRAEGPLGLELAVRGTPSEYDGRIDVDGPAASLLFRSPYLARLEGPNLGITVRDGRVALETGTARLNEGELTFSGVVLGEDGTDLRIGMADSLFRLDYGLLATVGADLRFRSTADGSSTLSGSLAVERGSLTRSVQLDLDLISQLLAPIDLTTTEDDPLDLIALDLEVRTREGVRVKNNLGDLLVRWEPLAVTGSLARPVIEGRLEVDPGGLLQVYGQTVRLDKAVIEYPGEEGAEPHLDFEATTSIEDPTIGRLAVEDPFRTTARQEETAGPAALGVTEDLARYYGEQFAGRVGESVGVSVSLRPLLIFGEADPGARLTVSRDLSPNLAIAASVDLRKAEGQTYLLELHELRQVPRLVAQAFTDDESAYGGALLQRQEFGGSRKESDLDLPRIAKLSVDPPAGVSKRGIKRALALEKGDRFDAKQRFVAEVELVDYLMKRGYPDAKVEVGTTPAGRRGNAVQLDIAIVPGPRVEFAFAGEKIPKPLRRLIQGLYRADFFELESIEEMRAETVRALRSRGFLEPRVEIAVEPRDSEQPLGDRRVTVTTEGGTKVSPEPPVFVGVPADDAEALQTVFANAVQRVELAVGLESADRRLVRALADLGYPEARIVSRYETLGERRLTVEIEPGPRQRITAVSIAGAEGELPVPLAELEPLVTVAAGDPLRRRALSRAALALERELGARGYLDARVRTVLSPAGDDDPHGRDVRFVADPGDLARLGEVEFAGLRSTNERWARRVTELEQGQALARDDLAAARTRLWRTGLFSGVAAEALAVEPGLRRVVFDLSERDRYRLTYGVRWDSEDGLGAVVDATDDNFLGRAWTLGLRALYSSDENSVRWLGRVPRAFGGPGSLELFAAAREVAETAFDIIFGTTEVTAEILEGTLQYSHPVGTKTTFRMYGRYTDTTRALPFITLRVRNPQLGFQYLFDSRSPEALTERGTFASVDLSGSQEFLGGDLRYVRLFSQLNHYRPAGRVLGRRLSWSQSFRLGLAEASGQQLIRDVRFFAGGEYSVRGYETESLGDLERFGPIVEPIGGEALLVVNQELRWRLFPDYVLVLFYDAGNVWRRKEDLGIELFESVGLGLRAQTPIGLLRLDFAHALDRRVDFDPEYKLYFGLGTTF